MRSKVLAIFIFLHVVDDARSHTLTYIGQKTLVSKFVYDHLNGVFRLGIFNRELGAKEADVLFVVFGKVEVLQSNHVRWLDLEDASIVILRDYER
jgi:hypothetical protein